MITLAKKNECTGCSACFSECSFSAITMENDEQGFMYPQISSDKCVECGQCAKVCPVLSDKFEGEKDNKTQYFARLKDSEEVKKSTSGGVFFGLAKVIIKNNGVVFGAILDENFTVVHKGIDTIAELYKLRGSKYVQSDLGNTFKVTKKLLEEGKQVLYSGTPCQIHGLVCFLKKDYSNLLCVDILCRSVPSPMLFEKYLELQKSNLGEIVSLSFRDKSKGYDYPNMKISYKNKKDKVKTYFASSFDDPWLRLFLSNEGDRPSCRKCIVEQKGYVSDITLGDYNDRPTMPREFDDNLGCSRVLINTEKAKKYIESNEDIKCFELKNPERKGTRPASIYGTKYTKDAFYSDAATMSGNDFFSKYYPVTMKVKVLRSLRNIVFGTGLYSALKKIYRKKRRGKR